MTRAEQKLYLTSARFRRYFGNMDQQVSEPSRFLSEIPADLIEEVGERRRKPAIGVWRHDLQLRGCRDQGFAGRQRNPSRLPREKVRWEVDDGNAREASPSIGNGTILRTEGDGDEMKLTISFMSHGLKKMIAKYAELEAAIEWITVTLSRIPEPRSVNVTKLRL